MTDTPDHGPLKADNEAPRKRVALRPRLASDAEALFPTMSDPEMMRWWSRAPFETVEELHAYFAPDDGSSWRSWAIVRAGDDQAIGFVASGQKREGVAEIGYLLAKDAQGRGYAREALTLLIHQLFAEGQRRIFADVDPDNQPSIALLNALGFTREGCLRAEWSTHIGLRDSLIYGLLAEEWSARNGMPAKAEGSLGKARAPAGSPLA
ncbi:GNAT family N-acetyltransferase [Novosphingobium terrae]|uniref:GNAT family N-acetyltransferase n=1 Tax=Novosphingobium terrae TaxID=2726189 RepID=UPI0019817045|nr:GNAT family protein [Novosphingobium terrae]